MNTPAADNVPATPTTNRAGVSRIKVIACGAIALLAIIGAVIAGALPRMKRARELDAAAAAVAAAPPRVIVVPAKQTDLKAERILPGTSLPLFQAAIYSRTTGYVARRLVDFGDRVTEGQLLAEIATPEVDAQLEQARAELVQSEAILVRDKAQDLFAQSEKVRYTQLVKTDAVSVEQFQSIDAQAKVATANVDASQSTLEVNNANIRRLESLQSFEKVTAPFAGVITARNIDVGDLVSADSTVRELYHLMRTDVIRVLVYVPQVFATDVNVGQSATVFRPELPDQSFVGKVTRTADALDANTRTMLTEVQISNPDNLLRPGMYLQVIFEFDREYSPIQIPAAALATRSAGPRVAVLTQDNRVQYRNVQLGRDYGAEIEVRSGIQPGEKIVVHPGDDLPEGSLVSPIPPPAE